MNERRTRPPAAALGWVRDAVGAQRVLRVTRLVGGITSAMHRVTVEDPSGARTDFVLRRWVGEDAEMGPDLVRNERRTLETLETTDIPAPKFVAADLDGGVVGHAALLMTLLHGHVELDPAHPDAWIREMARMLVRINATSAQGTPFESWLREERMTVPPWSAHPQLWREAIDLIKNNERGYDPRFVHRDFQQFNVLWRRGRIVGVVDWVVGMQGPLGIDLAHCRLNQTVLHSPMRAEQLRAAYIAEAGHTPDPWWDLHVWVGYLPGWGGFFEEQIAGRVSFDRAGMHARVDELLPVIMARLT